MTTIARRCGAHLVPSTRRVSFWCADVNPDIEARAAAANPGWQIDWERDRFESQLELAPNLRFPAIDEEAIIAGLQEYLLGVDFDHSNYLLDSALSRGREIQINRFALRDDPLPLDEDERQRIWESALGAWRASKDAR